MSTIESHCYSGVDIDALVGDTGAGGCEAGPTVGTTKKSLNNIVRAPIGKGSLPGGSSTCLEVIGHGSAHPIEVTPKCYGTGPEGTCALALGLGNAV